MLKLNLDYSRPAFFLNAAVALLMALSAVLNWRMYYHREDLMQRVAMAEKQARHAGEWVEYLRQKVECLASAKESDRQKCSP